MGFLAAFLLSIVSSQYIIVPILYSRFTPTSVINFFEKNYKCLDLASLNCTMNSNVLYFANEINNLADWELFASNRDFDFILDATYSLTLTSLISNDAKEVGFIQFVYLNNPDASIDFVYFLRDSYTLIRKSALALVDYFGWQKIAVILGEEYIDLNFKSIRNINIAFQASIPSLITYETLQLIISKQIKPLGIKVIIIATNPEISVMVQKAISDADMNKKGYVFIFLDQAGWKANLEGSLIISSHEYVPKSLEDYFSYLLGQLASWVMEIINISEIQGYYSTYNLGIIIKSISDQDYLFWINNIQNGQIINIGSITKDSVDIKLAYIFPGNSSIIPDNSKIQLPISFNGGISNPDGSKYEENAIFQTGSVFAVQYINYNQLLSNFNLVALNISDCGASVFDYNYSYTCFNKYTQKTGYFFLPGLQAPIAVGTVSVFHALNITASILGIQTTSSMSNSIYYPQYARVSYPNTLTASNAILMLTSFGISKCSFVCTNTSWGIDFKDQFEKQAKIFNIEIMNNNRIVPLGYNGTDKSIAEEIISLKSRYVVMEVAPPDVLAVIEAFYDSGARKGDIYLVVGDGTVNPADLNETQIGPVKYLKRKELMEGLIYFSFLSYHGTFGESLKTELLIMYGFAYDFMCLYFDATYLGALAIDFLITLGANLKDSSIYKAVRYVKFNGCSGKIKINTNGTDRSTIAFGIYNLVQNNSTWEMELCGIWDPSNVIMYQSINAITWYAWNNGKLPSDIVGADLPCPFKGSESKSFLYGYLLLAGIGSIPFIFGVCFIYKYFDFLCTREFPMLDSVEEETILDTWIYITMGIESLQYIALGPDFSELFPELSTFTKLSMFDLRNWTEDSKWDIWHQIKLMNIIAILWLILLLQRIFRIGENSKLLLFEALDELGKYCLPIIGDVLFLPIFRFLFLTYQCTDSIGDGYKDSYFYLDCKVFCWQDKHLEYVILSSVILIFYLPASLYFRPTWQDETESIVFHFREQPLHSIGKSFWQIVLVILRTTLLPASEIAENVCCTVIISWLVISTWFVRKPYNYHRASMWYSIFLTGCLWLWICTAFSLINLILAQCLLGIGWVSLGAAGTLYQSRYLPSLLVSAKGQDIKRLFKFQLSKKTPSQAGIEGEAKYFYVEKSNDEAQKLSYVFDASYMSK
ncbi:unnamed protein product [Blepharisma stoltei]|uniref:Receptor ligand binding region domain-containing protein n=1 Tax=Blepharisma stoltei TaxID=1481888 RepID=A0AAU9J1A1_9CILI|nr:unnamed protein product [Blepharisma stoltei]